MEFLLILQEDLKKDCRLMEFNGIVINTTWEFEEGLDWRCLMELLLICQTDLRKDCRLMEFNGIVIDITGGFEDGLH